MFGIGDSLADLNAFDAGDGDDVSRGDGLGLIAVQAAKSVELGDARGLERAIELDDADLVAAAQGALKDARNGDAAQIIAVVEIGDLHLQGTPGIARGRVESVFTMASNKNARSRASSPPDSAQRVWATPVLALV